MDRLDSLSHRELRAIKRQRLRDLAELETDCEKWLRRHARVKRFGRGLVVAFS